MQHVVMFEKHGTPFWIKSQLGGFSASSRNPTDERVPLVARVIRCKSMRAIILTLDLAVAHLAYLLVDEPRERSYKVRLRQAIALFVLYHTSVGQSTIVNLVLAP